MVTGKPIICRKVIHEHVIFAAPCYGKKDTLRGASYGMMLITPDRMIIIPLPSGHIHPDMTDTREDTFSVKNGNRPNLPVPGILPGWNPWSLAPVDTWTGVQTKSFVRKKMHGYYVLRILRKLLSPGFAQIRALPAGFRSSLHSILSNPLQPGIVSITS